MGVFQDGFEIAKKPGLIGCLIKNMKFARKAD